MKAKLFVFTLFSLFLLMQLGCEPETIVEEATDHLVIDTSLKNYTFGNKIDIVVCASLWGPISSNYKMDLNNDSTDDIEFFCNVYHHTVYDEWIASVKTLNDNVALDVEQDTVLIASYSIAYFNPSINDSIRITYNENFSTSKQYPSNLTITSEIYDLPVIHTIGDSLNPFCIWKSGGFILESDNHHQGEIQNNIQLGNWRGINRKFIGVRFVEKSIPYYGWIELSVDNYYITLYKYAIQMK